MNSYRIKSLTINLSLSQSQDENKCSFFGGDGVGVSFSQGGGKGHFGFSEFTTEYLHIFFFFLSTSQKIMS